MLYVLFRDPVPNVGVYRYKGGCRQYIAPINTSGAAARDALLSRSFVDLPTSPFPPTGHLHCWSTDTRIGKIIRIGGTPGLPTLSEWKSSIAHKYRSENFRQRVRQGEIVVNPMLTSEFIMRDFYIPKTRPGGQSKGAMIYTQRTKPIVRACGGKVVEYSNSLWEEAQSHGVDTLGASSQATISAAWFATESADAVGPALQGVYTQAGHNALHSELIAALSKLPFSTSLTTSVVADTRAGTYDLLTDMVEFKSTVQTLMSCVVRILKMYIDTKNRVAFLSKKISRKKGFSKVADAEVQALNSQWLEFRYGITPIVLSANAAIDWLNTRNHEYAKFRGTESRQVDLTVGNLRVTLPIVIDRAFGKVRVDGATAGLTLNPLRTALELVPMSLLLNWVCNIGDVLTACWPPSAAKQEVYTVSRSVPRGIYPAVWNGHQVSIDFGYYKIDEIKPLDHVGLVFGNNMSWRRFIDAFAFAYNPLKKLLTKKVKP